MDSSSFDFYIAVVATAFCCLFVFFTLRSSSSSSRSSKSSALFDTSSHKRRKSCGCDCACSVPVGVAGGGPKSMPSVSVVAEQQTAAGGAAAGGGGGGASMMEQLVPEITTHTLSYLDYPSLCRLSMTNSAMRKAANDDSAWKALYRKDFTVEQDSVTPPNGWKAYYAATRAIINVNAQFYNIIQERSVQAMRQFWLQADYVKCIHYTGELFTGYDAVIQSWQHAFNWGQGVAVQVRDVRARLLADMAWVTMNTYVDMETVPFHVTNVYEFHNGRWYMVHHHSSLVLANAGMENQNAFG